ncbi:inositol monophosphatase family protein [Anaerosacchariphilus polymeriproducens]|uniref:Inositol monophosphatase n=1 Tax=Anaerosacchariphilus polymeriproducens TaxID=1812858 RepID=A0A371ATC6_9FIRM|nr:inositol monophosphatase family protein [Anaerosacchariphilus polymeriproducens]RDU22825.1 hypothetical protein DWV06_12825 [Anaerosacchariphilus polymeriproducens]
MREYIFNLSNEVIGKVKENFDVLKSKDNMGISSGGDTQFDIDEVAEEAVMKYFEEHTLSVAYYSEDRGLVKFGDSPKYVFVIDPIDGTRSAAAGLESCCFSVAVAAYKEDATIDDVEYALLYEFKSDTYFYADCFNKSVSTNCGSIVPSPKETIDRLFWSMEFNGHPSRLITYCLGDLIDATANKGGIFIFNSSTYSISRILTGQLEAYVDIGNRLVRDVPELVAYFRKVGNGKLLHLFPYDIAAAVFIAKKAGIIVTDAYGNDLGCTKLLDIKEGNLQSCIAASNKKIHEKIMDSIKWVNHISEVEKVLS